MIVLFSPVVQDYFYELENILYEKEYYSCDYEAIEYVDNLIFDIKNNLPSKQHKPVPPFYNKYGKNLYYLYFYIHLHINYLPSKNI